MVLPTDTCQLVQSYGHLNCALLSVRYWIGFVQMYSFNYSSDIATIQPKYVIKYFDHKYSRSGTRKKNISNSLSIFFWVHTFYLLVNKFNRSMKLNLTFIAFVSINHLLQFCCSDLENGINFVLSLKNCS
jgi:hypothetical protein